MFLPIAGSLNLRKAFSEAPGQFRDHQLQEGSESHLMPLLESADSAKDEEQILNFSELKAVPRLSCFEDICPPQEELGTDEHDNYVTSLEELYKGVEDLVRSELGLHASPSLADQSGSLSPLNLGDQRLPSTMSFGQYSHQNNNQRLSSEICTS